MPVASALRMQNGHRGPVAIGRAETVSDDEALRRTDLLGEEKEKVFDRVTRLAASLLDCEVVLLSIIEEHRDRQFFKSEHGLSTPHSQDRQTPLSHSFCKTVVAEDGTMRVTDARTDPRVHQNPAVSELNVIAYLGVPVRDATGAPFASLCAISHTPRDWADSDEETLLVLAESISREIKLRQVVHQKEQIAQGLSTMNEKFQDLARNVPGAIFQYVLHPDGSDGVEYMSPGCIDIWEVSAEAIAVEPSLLWEIIVPDDVEGMRSSIGRSAERLAPWEYRWRVVTRSGVEKVLQGYGRPRRLESGAILWNSAIFDVTVEANAQEKLQSQSKRLAEMQKQDVIGRLAGGIAHDFNNLLAIILGNAELLLHDNTASEAEEFVREIILASQRGSELTRSVLDFARRSDLKPEIADLNASVERMASLMRRTLPENIAIEQKLRPKSAMVEIDSGALERVLLNLAVNARDAMPGGGKLTIETSMVQITDDYIEDRYEDISPGAYVMLAVSDTGSGIAPHVIDHVFEPFFSTKGPDGGTGLGLAVVYGFAKQSGGTVRIYSEVGHGTSVKVYLPSAGEGRVVEAERAVAPAAGGTQTILLVEDNDGVRRSVRRILESHGYDVVSAMSADSAVDHFLGRQGSIDLILTDVVMPGRLQGPDLVRAFRQARPDMPAIFMSGYPHEANIHGNGIRASDVSLLKPVSSADLLFTLQDTLARARGD